MATSRSARQLLGRRAVGGQPRALAAEHHAELEDLAEQRQIGCIAVAEQQVRDEVDPRRAHEVGDARAVPLARAHEPDELERFYRLAQRAAVHAEALGQLALRRDLVASTAKAPFRIMLPKLAARFHGLPGGVLTGPEHFGEPC